MRIARWLEVLSGCLSSLVGMSTLAYLLFVPIYRGTGCTTLPDQPPDCTGTFATLLNATDPGMQAEVALVVALLVGVGVRTLWHIMLMYLLPYTGKRDFSATLACARLY